MRFKEVDTDLLFDCQMMDDGVIVRQCPPNQHNLFFMSFEAFIENFEESYIQGEFNIGPGTDYTNEFDENDEGDCS